MKPKTALRPAPPPELAGRKVWMPRLWPGSSEAMAAVLRSIGIDAECTPPSNERTRELGARATCGDECYPTKVTLGDFLRVLEQPGTDPARTTFLMATGNGPCRFGQYAPYMKSVFDSLGYSGVTLLSPGFESGYSNFGDSSTEFLRSAWRAIVATDLLQKLVLRARPYEAEPGSADACHAACLADLCAVLETPHRRHARQMAALRHSLLRARERFRALRLRTGEPRPLVGIVGEFFCRLNCFSNDHLVRRLERAGAEVWMNDVAEWIWYTNHEVLRLLGLAGKRFSRQALGARVRAHFQRRDEHRLLSLLRRQLAGREEPDSVEDVLACAEPYLPASGASGEMVINVGKAVYFARKGLDGVIDISPFTCMNGIICEAVYPCVSRDNAGIPIRNFYFDGTQSDLDRDLGIFLELARNYRRRRGAGAGRA